MKGLPSSFQEGQKLAGSYVLRRQAPSAAGETIWMAADEVLGKEVSLHFIPSAVRDDVRALDALRTEVKRSRQLIHPSILRVYDFIEEPEWAAISMDSFEGESLASHLLRKNGGFYEPAQIEEWLTQICQTLQDAHKIQLVHRDLSPRNIFIETSGKVVLANFVIGRLIQDAFGRIQPAGKPEPGLAYTSPQQLDGERPAVTDDIYAIGVLCHELLTGAVPFSGADVVAQIRRKVPASIADRRAELGKVGGAIPAEWEKAIGACLAKVAEQRPKSIAELVTRFGFASAPGTATAAPAKAAAAVTSIAAASAPTQVRQSSPPPAPKPAKADPVFTHSRAEAPKSREASTTDVSRKTPKFKEEDETEREAELVGAGSVPEDFPSFGPRRSSFPLTGLAAAAILIGIGVYGVFFYPQRNSAPRDGESLSSQVQEEGSSLAAVANPASSPFDVEPEPLLTEEAADEAPTPRVATTEAELGVPALPSVASGDQPPVVPAATLPSTAAPIEMAARTPRDEKAKSTPAPAATPARAAAGGDTSLAAKAAALEKAQKDAEAAERAHAALIKQQQDAEAAAADARKKLEDKTKSVAPVMKAGEEIAAARKAREEEVRAAELAAEEAQRLAAEKVKAVEEARKSLTTMDKDGKEKLTARQKAEAELQAAQKAVDDKARVAAEAAKAVTDAAAQREAQLATIARSQQEFAEAKAMAQKASEETARRAAEQKKVISAQMAEIQAAKEELDRKMRQLEAAVRAAENPDAPAAPAPSPAPADPLPVKPEPLKKPETSAIPPTAPAGETAAASKVETAAVTPPPTPTASTPPAAPVPDLTVAMKTDPAKPTATPAPDEKKAPSTQPGFVNSLEMKFAPVGDVLFCVWQTRVKDFETFASATGLRSTLWKAPGFKQGPDHPVVNVTWQEATAFCKWLTVKEHKEGILAAHQVYRLPFDLEWSKAVGLPEETGKTPEARDMGVPDVYPWGNAWPPPPGAGNYTGEETGSDVAIKGYDDGFAWTSPVGSFPANQFGLFDMGGNVWQWCMDSWNGEQKARVLRGASWYNGALKLSLLSSCRVHAAPDSSTDNYGFRCVVASAETSRGTRK